MRRSRKCQLPQKYSAPLLHYITLQIKFCNGLYFLKKKNIGQKVSEWRSTHLVHSHYANLPMLTIKAVTVWPSQMQYDKSCLIYEFVQFFLPSAQLKQPTSQTRGFLKTLMNTSSQATNNKRKRGTAREYRAQ